MNTVIALVLLIAVPILLIGALLRRNTTELVIEWIKKEGEIIGVLFLFIGLLFLSWAVILSVLLQGTSKSESTTVASIALGMISLGLGSIALSQSIKQGEKIEIIDSKLPLPVVQGDTVRRDVKIEVPVATAQASALPPSLEGQTKEEAQARLDSDTKAAGKKRGELVQLSNGRWGINWIMEVNETINIEGCTKTKIERG